MSAPARLQPHEGYDFTHPWYYYLGGPIPKLQQLRDFAEANLRVQLLEDKIKGINRVSEPNRSQQLQQLILWTGDGLRHDIARYRECVRELRNARRKEIGRTDMTRSCRDIDVSMSLKVSHLCNGFSNLHLLQDVPQQFDLFG